MIFRAVAAMRAILWPKPRANPPPAVREFPERIKELRELEASARQTSAMTIAMGDFVIAQMFMRIMASAETPEQQVAVLRHWEIAKRKLREPD
ncbi:MAG: hypothetical protein JWP57_4378 [Spirosoma sp.]|nr:hypothetical protein [Spirosoma sp.]